MTKTTKFYVVFTGREPGIYKTWEECKAQVDRFPSASFKSFSTMEDAEVAYRKIQLTETILPELHSLSGDGSACPCPGKMEFRVVDSLTKELIHEERFPFGTNNIAEFLALVEACRRVQCDFNHAGKVVYTDSMTALTWLREGRVNTSLELRPDTERLFQRIADAETTLRSLDITKIDIRKWPTEKWGEIPADYGRK
jgi:ribonuclease HI